MGADPRTAFDRLRTAATDGRLEAVCERQCVRLLTVFGSVLRQDAEPRDLDVAARFEPGCPGDVLGLLDDLVRLTSSDDIDLMDLARAGPVARERGLVQCLALYESEPGAYATAQMAAIGERLDTDWLREMDLQAMRA